MTVDTQLPETTQTKETARIETFADGVFAIIITLMAFALRVPQQEELADGVTLLEVMASDWPSYLTFFVSFLTIGVMWINHHRMFASIKRTDHIFLLINVAFLFGVSIVPFSTALVAEYLQHREATTAMMVYNLVYILMALLFNAVWRYATWNNRLIEQTTNREIIEGIWRRYRFGPMLYVVPLLVAFIEPGASFFINLVLAVFWALPTSGEILRRSSAR